MAKQPKQIRHLLINEQPHFLLPSLALKVGIAEALIIQRIHYWCSTNEEKKTEKVFKDGHWWCYHSIANWHKKDFPYVSERHLKRLFAKLLGDKDENGEYTGDGFLIRAEYNQVGYDRTWWYRPNYDKVVELMPDAQGDKLSQAKDKMSQKKDKMSQKDDNMSQPIQQQQNIKNNSQEQQKGDVGAQASPGADGCSVSVEPPPVEEPLSTVGAVGAGRSASGAPPADNGGEDFMQDTSRPEPPNRVVFKAPYARIDEVFKEMEDNIGEMISWQIRNSITHQLANDIIAGTVNRKKIENKKALAGLIKHRYKNYDFKKDKIKASSSPFDDGRPEDFFGTTTPFMNGDLIDCTSCGAKIKEGQRKCKCGRKIDWTLWGLTSAEIFETLKQSNKIESERQKAEWDKKHPNMKFPE